MLPVTVTKSRCDFTISGGSAPYDISWTGPTSGSQNDAINVSEEATKLQVLQVVIMILQLLMITVVF